MIRGAALFSAILLLPVPTAANPSLECSVSSESQIETGQCLQETAQAAEAALAVILDASREAAAELDGITERDVALPALDASQSAWEIYRDAQCTYAGSLFGGGSGTGIEIQSCQIQVTRNRINELQAKLR